MAAERTSSLVSRINVNGKYMFSCMYAMFLLVMPNQGQPEVGSRGRVKRNRDQISLASQTAFFFYIGRRKSGLASETRTRSWHNV